MIVSPFGFLAVQVEGVSGEAFELCQPRSPVEVSQKPK